MTVKVSGRETGEGATLIRVKPRVYIETTIVSYLTGWLNRHDLYVASNQELTRQ